MVPNRMTEIKSSGFVEKPHTADWALEVWAVDYPTLLVEAARGMYALMGTRLQPGRRQVREFTLQARDREGLLVQFLSELLYIGEQDGLGFDRLELTVEGDRLSAHLEGAAIEQQGKEIKAVTFHNLAIKENGGRLEATITFDV